MYKFVKEDDSGFVDCVYYLDEESTWMEVVEKFQEFLRGSGFVFKHDFDMAAILEEAHRDLLARSDATSYKSKGTPCCMADQQYGPLEGRF